MGCFRVLGNLLWIIFTGLWSAILYFFLGILWCITIIGIPFGLQSFKFARLFIWPFGSHVQGNFGKHPIANIIWMIFGGLFSALGFLLLGLIWCITIVGIPFGLQCFKLAKLALAPFGAEITTGSASNAA